MASTYTTRLRLEKQGDGENPNSWGTILNTNVIDLLDQAIAGYVKVSVSSAAITLTNLNGQSDESRNAILEVAGSLTANVTITIPQVQKTYFVKGSISENNFGVFLTTGAGNNYRIPKDYSTIVMSDGASISAIEPQTSVSAFTVNTLSVVSAANFVGPVSGTTGIFSTQLITPIVSTAASLALRVNDADRVHINSSGNVGIGTSVQVKQLEITKSARAWLVSLTDAASIAINFNTAQNFVVQLGGNRTLENPTNCVEGQTGSIFLVQDGTGSRTLSFGTHWKFPSGTAPTLTTDISARDRVDYIVFTSAEVQAVVTYNIK